MFDRSNVAEHTFRMLHWVDMLFEYWEFHSTNSQPWTDGFKYAVWHQVLFHDIGERFTGDMRHDIKRHDPAVQQGLKGLEKHYINRYYPTRLKLPNQAGSRATKDIIKTISKCADILEFMFEAHKEIKCRNPEPECVNAIRRGFEIYAELHEAALQRGDMDERTFIIGATEIATHMKEENEYLPR